MRKYVLNVLGVLAISVSLMACGNAGNEQTIVEQSVPVAVEQVRQDPAAPGSDVLESPEKADPEIVTEIEETEQMETGQEEVDQPETEQTEVNQTEDGQIQTEQTEVNQTEGGQIQMEQTEISQTEVKQIQEDHVQTGQEEENDMKMNIQIGENLLTATLVKNSSTDALVEMLSEGPVTIAMNDYAGMEKVGPFPRSLPRNDEQISTGAGDLILYQGSSFVIYYDTNSWNFTRLGKVDNVTGQELMDILGSGSVTAVLSLPAD